MKRQISVLDQSTIDKIAAGEVVERPSSVVKELVENAIDAGASAITVEIKEGGTTFIRITDNGTGIEKEQVPLAFLRHATSKIRKVEDLSLISSLGFRGEALSSIAAVSRVELITKPHEQLIGVRYQIEGGMEKGMEEIGAPDGPALIIRDDLYNTPARAKFLKTPTTEAGYISSFIEQLALSHPHISFKYMQNGQTKLHTSGNNNLKEAIYQIYGRDITRELIEIHTKDRDETIRIDGFIGKPVISRGNRNFENYYVNGRYVKSKIVTKAVEDAYHTFMMQHKYPFTCLHIQIKGSDVDVNVHPTKMEVRFSDQELIYRQIYQTIIQGLQHKELIPQVTIGKDRLAVRPANRDKAPEPFEVQRRQIEQPRGYQMQQKVQPEELKNRAKAANPIADRTVAVAASGEETHKGSVVREQGTGCYGEKRETGYRNENPAKQNPNLQVGQVVLDRRDNIAAPGVQKAEQMDLFDGKLLSPEAKKHHKIIGQVFDTYWLVQMEDKLYIIDQHAAQERYHYEQIRSAILSGQKDTQMLVLPLQIETSPHAVSRIDELNALLGSLGIQFEAFGEQTLLCRELPVWMKDVDEAAFLRDMIDIWQRDERIDITRLREHAIATMACHSSIRFNRTLNEEEMKRVIDDLNQCEQPFHCPHGRPTIVCMSDAQLRKEFERG